MRGIKRTMRILRALFLAAGVGMILLLFASIYQVLIGGVIQNRNQNGSYDLSELGLPPWVTQEILVTSLELQEEYGIYASVTIAQAQQEVGGTWNGTRLYDTASVDYNLFGLKATGGASNWNGEST